MYYLAPLAVQFTLFEPEREDSAHHLTTFSDLPPMIARGTFRNWFLSTTPPLWSDLAKIYLRKSCQRHRSGFRFEVRIKIPISILI